MGANLRRRAADLVEEARRNGRQKRRLDARPFSELKQSRGCSFSSFLGICFPARRCGFEPCPKVPFWLPADLAQSISRFTTCVLQSGIELPYNAIKTNIADSLNIIIQIERSPGSRYVSEVLEVHGFHGYDPETDRYDLEV